MFHLRECIVDFPCTPEELAQGGVVWLAWLALDVFLCLHVSSCSLSVKSPTYIPDPW